MVSEQSISTATWEAQWLLTSSIIYGPRKSPTPSPYIRITWGFNIRLSDNLHMYVGDAISYYLGQWKEPRTMGYQLVYRAIYLNHGLTRSRAGPPFSHLLEIGLVYSQISGIFTNSWKLMILEFEESCLDYFTNRWQKLETSKNTTT